MSMDAIKAALYTWMQRETGLTVIYSRQGKPRPAYPYGEINFTNPALRLGSIDEMRTGGEDGDEFTQAGLRIATASLNIYGDAANDKMSTLRDSLDRPDVVEEFATKGIAHVSETGPNDLTVLEDTTYPERSQMDLRLMFAIEHATEVVPIEAAEITVSFNDQEEVLVIGEPFEE